MTAPANTIPIRNCRIAPNCNSSNVSKNVLLIFHPKNKQRHADAFAFFLVAASGWSHSADAVEELENEIKKRLNGRSLEASKKGQADYTTTLFRGHAFGEGVGVAEGYFSGLIRILR